MCKQNLPRLSCIAFIVLALTFTYAPLAGAASLVNGRVVSGAISFPGEKDSYTFTANAGENVHIRVADTSNNDFYPLMKLYGPSGSQINSTSNPSVASIHTRVTVNGTYTVTVTNSTYGDPNVTGNYNVYFVRMPGANEGGTLTNGGVTANTIDLGDLDSYTFTANVGESVEIRVADTSNNDFAPGITLYGPSGNELRGTSSPSVATIHYHGFAVSGTYTVVVTDRSNGLDATGNYNLYFVHMPGANEGGTLINGGIRTGTIDLGDLDSYTFTGTVGEYVRIRVADTSNNDFAPIIRFYGPSGHLMGWAVATGPSASRRERMNVNGTYTVVVADASSGIDIIGNSVD